ncbi:MAG: hypothetical protein WC438_01670 [Candidatus Pacearchaeota archaeon]
MITKEKRKKFKKQGQYPRKTRNWLRYRQEEPGKFSEFRIKKISNEKELVLGKLKKTGKWKVQSVMKKGFKNLY